MSNPIVQPAITAPHYLASEAGMEILQQGGSAVDAVIAASATLSVVYPHMNGLTGDGFWLIHQPDQAPLAIDACGRSAQNLDVAFYQQQGAIPTRGESACITMGGVVSGWQRAREHIAGSTERLPLDALFKRAIEHARQGYRVTPSLQHAIEKVAGEQSCNDAWQALYCPNGQPYQAGQKSKNPHLADWLETLAENGLEDFYQGELADHFGDFFAASESFLRPQDFASHQAVMLEPLSLTIRHGRVYNLPAPTQGLASLLILGLYDRLQQPGLSDAQQVHLLVEATKLAFVQRNRHIADPDVMSLDPWQLLQAEWLDKAASQINPDQAMPWPLPALPGDTVWLSALDQNGVLVSYIQSIYWEFGSAVVIPGTGMVWNNRGSSFSLESNSLNALAPGRKPLHTLNPALALFHDGRRMAYGTMGGEGQPQTQAAIFNRYAYQDMTLSQAIAAPRWLLGRTWGDDSHNLKLEADLMEQIGLNLAAMGHEVASVENWSELMGHAGAIVVDGAGRSEAASDPRSDGIAIVDHTRSDAADDGVSP